MKTLSIKQYILTLTAITLFSGIAKADCPDDMPLNILEDCIVAEGSGGSFPNETYSNLEEYNEWLNSRIVDVEKATNTNND